MKKSELRKLVKETILQEGSSGQALKDLVEIGKMLSDKHTLANASSALEKNPNWARKVANAADELLDQLSMIV